MNGMLNTMKQPILPTLLLTAVAVGLTPFSLEAAQAGDPGALRTKAKTMLAALPDKMPGAENDTPALVDLGKKLYFEKRLSLDEKMSCNTCHQVDNNHSGVDNEATSLGVHGKRGDRNSPTSLNAGFHFAQFWDGRAKNLEEQAKGPVLNPVEMAMPNEAEVIKRLSTDAEYPKLFKAAFPGIDSPLNYDNVARAVAAFERTLITRDRFDDFLKGDDKALTATEQRGLDLFLTTGCTTCHTGPLIGANMYQKIGIFHAYPNTADKGRFKVTNEDWDEYRFKVPSLRNVALTWPYFHDGAVADLDTAIRQMTFLQLDRKLADEEVGALKAFLTSLSDKNRRACK
jgi:cytochrome c peroxidase